MKEFKPKTKQKIVTKEFLAKYVYILMLAVLLIGGISYGYTFFTQNRKIASGSITTAGLTVNFTDRNINAIDLSIPSNDKEGLKEFSKTLTITNTTNTNGKVKLSLTRTSGLALNSMKYAIIVNGAIQKIDDVPVNGEILSSAIMGNEVINVEVRLWPKTTYSGNETNFVGEITPEIKYLGTIASELSNPSGKYVNFNCNGNDCELWQIVKIEDNRLVLTKQANYNEAGERINSNRYIPNSFNPAITFNDDSLITSLSTDGLNVYLAKTVKLTGGNGTIDNPYTLENTDFREGDKKILATITYKNDNNTIGNQNIYYNETNYISQVADDIDFVEWIGETNNYVLGDTITFTTDTILTAKIKDRLQRRIMTLCNDTNVSYVKKYNAQSNGQAIDTPDGSGNEDICYYTSTDSNNYAGLNGNVIFGNYCWQIVRTTADGGVKLLYNGLKTNDNKCPNDSSLRPSTTGFIGNSGSSTNMTGNKLYGKGFTYSGNTFTLTDTFTANWNGDVDGDNELDYPKIIGTYTCFNNSNSCSTIYFVGHYYDSTKAYVTSYTIESLTNYHQIGISSFNAGYDSLAATGYMYNKVYNLAAKDVAIPNDVINRTATQATDSFIFADQATWNGSTYVLSNSNNSALTASTWSSIRNTNGAHGLYTCRSNTLTSCDTVYYVEGKHSENYMYHLTLTGGESINDKTIVIGTGYAENGGVYSLTGTTTIYLKDWFNNYTNSSYKNVYICDNLTSATCTNERYYISDTNNYRIFYSKEDNNYIYGNSVSYANGEYTIDTSTDTTKYQHIWKWNSASINNSHYTCFKTDTNNCGSSVYYIYNTNGHTAYYVELKNNERVDDALQNMININNSENSDINKYNSAAKGLLENWYEKNLATLSNYLDDNAVYCNDRSVADLQGWSPIGSTKDVIRFKSVTNALVGKESLACDNITDRFSVNNSKAKIKYSIGLLNEAERVFMNKYYANSNEKWWIMSPHILEDVSAIMRLVNEEGNSGSNNTRFARGIRPAIVLKPGTEIEEGGNGTYNTPYVINVSS